MAEQYVREERGGYYFDQAQMDDLPNLSGNDVKVLLVLGNHVSGRYGDCFPSNARIQKLAGISEETVRKSLRALEEGGHIAIKERFLPDGTQTSSLYTILDKRTPLDSGGRVQVLGGSPSQKLDPNKNQSNKNQLPLIEQPSPVKPSGDKKVNPVGEIVLAYFDGLEQLGRKVDRKNFSRWVAIGKKCLEMGYSPGDIKSMTVEMGSDKWWDGKVLPLERVLDRLNSRPAQTNNMTMRKAGTDEVRVASANNLFTF